MNSKGQVLVLFIVFVPLLLMVLAFAIDMGITYSQASKLDSVNKMTIKYGLENRGQTNIEDRLITLINNNEKALDGYDLVIGDEEINLELNKTINSVFGKVVGIDSYEIDSVYSGYIENDKIVIRKGN